MRVRALGPIVEEDWRAEGWAEECVTQIDSVGTHERMQLMHDFFTELGYDHDTRQLTKIGGQRDDLRALCEPRWRLANLVVEVVEESELKISLNGTMPTFPTLTIPIPANVTTCVFFEASRRNFMQFRGQEEMMDANPLGDFAPCIAATCTDGLYVRGLEAQTGAVFANVYINDSYLP